MEQEQNQQEIKGGTRTKSTGNEGWNKNKNQQEIKGGTRTKSTGNEGWNKNKINRK